MKSIPSQIITVVAVSVLSTIAVAGSPSRVPAFGLPRDGGQAKDQSKDKKQSPPSDAEQKAMAKVEAAADTPAKIQAAGEFVKKYPKSSLRPRVIGYVVQEIDKLPDATQRFTQFESVQTMFKDPADAEVIAPILVEAYFKENRFDDGFRVASEYLPKSNDLALLTRVAMIGVEQAKQRNPKFVAQAQQFGTKAIEIIESGKKPETIDDAKWSEYQTRWLPSLYQSLGMLSMMTGNRDDARTKINKALSLNNKDPFSYVLLGSMLNEEYQQLAQQHKTLTAGPQRDSVLKQAHDKLDQIIDAYAHGVGLSEGNPAYQVLHDQILQDLQSYYKYRHGGSTDGLQQLIDKYKQP
ncbi:MAG TPA: hypothetical protein VLM38_02385 [Blastocatellia bacterium]|nr:hypothetical protein [Blastocatellia bacterium]